MKVKELIERLKELDPEKGIFILYDECTFYEPKVDRLADDVDEALGELDKVKEGDYIMEVG